MAVMHHQPYAAEGRDGIGNNRVAFYLRSASGTDVDIQRQEKAIRANLANHPQWRVVAAYRDTATSAFHRPVLQRALRAAVAGEFDVLVVHRVDRLARRIADLTTILDTLRRASVALLSATEPLDTSTRHGQVLADLITGLAEFGRGMPQVRPSRGVEPRRHHVHRTLRRGAASGG